MKKACSILLVLSLGFMVMACGTAPTQATTPDWLEDIPPEDVLWGIGVAKLPSASESMRIAEARARVAIARCLNARVESVFKSYLIDYIGEYDFAKDSLYEEISRQIPNMDFSSARPIKRWQANDGTWWYLVEYRKSDAMNMVASILKNQEANYIQFENLLRNTLRNFESHLSKSEKAIIVDD
jgi:hypothetical protein